MEDGAKEDPAQSKVPKFLGKAGWVKKATGRLLAGYKDRYIHVERTEIVVYENEDLQKCLERFSLENYDKCHELKSPFSKKHRLIVIRSPKSGNKVHDVKFQAQTAEEKEAWIKAVSDGINRAKNKVFDEVKVDESSNLEHVTRTRPKGNRNRRPPTRIHMKEVAGVSSDGILRLDLDLEDAIMPNGTHNATVDGNEAPKEAKKVLMPPSNAKEVADKQAEPIAEEEAQTESEVSPPKKVIKPPMPPTKVAKPISTPEEEPEKDNSSEKKVLKPPMPPSKEAKPCASPDEEATEGATTEKTSEKSPEVKKKEPPPTPPNKPNNPAEASQSRPNSHVPCPPSQDKKPSSSVVEPNQEVQSTTDENKEKEEDNRKETTVTPVEMDEPLPSDRDDKTPSTEQQVCEEESGETISSGINKASNNEPQVPVSLLSTSTELPRKSPPTPKKKPSELHEPNTHIEDNTTGTHVGEDPTLCLQTASDTSLQAEEALPKSEVPTVMVCLNDPVADSLNLSPLLCHSPGEKKKKEEEKSVDSGQHSDDDSEGSGSEDTLAASTAALRGSHPGLDLLDASEDDIQTPVSLQPPKVAAKPEVRAKVFPFRHSAPVTPLKPSHKAKSASSGDLLTDSSASRIQLREDTRTVSGSDGAPGVDVMKLETEVALEMKTTSELLSKVSQSQKGGVGEGMPKDLLAEAMEKLKMADNVLREVKKLKHSENSKKRNSW